MGVIDFTVIESGVMDFTLIDILSTTDNQALMYLGKFQDVIDFTLCNRLYTHW